VHICHAPADRRYAERLVRHLADAGVPATVDDEHAESLDLDLVRERIEAARAVVVIMRSGDELAERVADEVNCADQLGRDVFPLSVGDRSYLILNHLRITDVPADRMPDADFTNRLRRAIGARPEPSGRSTRRRRLPIPLLVFAAVILVLGAGAVIALRGRSNDIVEPRPTGATGLALSPASPDDPLPPGTVTITDPADDAVVDRCTKVLGRANLDPGQTILFATNRISPPDTMWYITYAGPYRNGFVAPDWHGEAYLGSSTRQSYDLFVVVMDAKAAASYFAAHKQGDGSFAADKERPAGTAAHVRLRQGTTNDC
jgi:hypothetical protein